MQTFRKLSRLAFVLISAASFTACTTAPFDVSDYFPKPKVKALPPAPTADAYPEAQIPETLTSAPAPEDSTYGKGILIDIPGNLFGKPPWRTL